MSKVNTAIILLAGMGSRLRPLTETQHKALISIGDHTILERQVKDLHKHGITKIHLVLGYRSDDIQNFVKDHFKDLNIEFQCHDNPIYQKTNTGYSLSLVLKDSKSSFLLLDGDVILGPELLAELCQDTDKSLLLSDTDRSKLDIEAVRFRVNDANQILEIGKHISLEDSAGESIGVGLYQSDWANSLAKYFETMIQDESKWQWYYEDAMQDMIKSDLAPSALQIVSTGDQNWVEVDDHKDLERAKTLFG